MTENNVGSQVSMPKNGMSYGSRRRDYGSGKFIVISPNPLILAEQIKCRRKR